MYRIKKTYLILEKDRLSFAHQTLSIEAQEMRFQPVLISGANAYYFTNNNHNKWKDSLKNQIKNHYYSNEVFVSLVT